MIALAVVCLLLASATPASHAADPLAPIDYTKIKGLSAPVHKSVVTETLTLPMKDGIEVYIEVTRPKAKGKFPVIAEISPYHGTIYQRDGIRMLPEQGGLVKYFVPRGYAVVMMDLRGTGRSQGCLDHMGPNDQQDAKAVVEWAASRAWSNGKVGVLGHSYPGGTSVMTLGERPKGLATIVVSAGLGSMYEHQFQGGVPYLLQWAGPYIGYPPLTIERHLPVGLAGVGSGNGGDNLGNDMEYFGCGLTAFPAVDGLQQLNAVDQLSGRYAPWHGERDFRAAAARNPIPVFVVHGINDHAARVGSLDWFLRRGRATDKFWLGQWGHGSGCCPNQRDYQWTMALHAWFDKQLQSRDVDTGPPVEIFLADATEQDAIEGSRTQIYTAKKFPVAARKLSLYPYASGALSSTRPDTAGSRSFYGDPLTVAAGPGFGSEAMFRTDKLGRDMLLLGMPKLSLVASVTMPRVSLLATLYDESPDATLRRLGQFALNPELRDGLDKTRVVVPGKKYVMDPPGTTLAHNLRKGHRLVMNVTTSEFDKVPIYFLDPHVEVFTGPGETVLQVPVVDRPTYYKDAFNRDHPEWD